MSLLSAAAGFSLAAWIYLLLARGGFWRARERLAPATPAGAAHVEALIPARNEAASIAATVEGLLGSTYPGRLGVTVIDDHSSDATAEIARESASATGRSGALRVLAAPPLAAGWSGKLAALQAGLDAAPPCDFVLLTDADIVLAPESLSSLVAKAEREGLALVSLMARLDARGGWGGLLIPAFVFFFQKLYPFALVNDPASKVAGAAGGCVLVRRDALEAIGGFRAISGALIDDCALARAIKHGPPPGRIWLGLAGREAYSVRDNRRFSSIWTMVARTAFTQLGRSWLNLAGAVFGMGLIYLAPPVIAILTPLHQEYVAGAVTAGAWGLSALAYTPTLRLYGQSAWKAFALPIAASLYTSMTIGSAINHASGRGGAWKGRTYS